jgi:hypothetical protein
VGAFLTKGKQMNLEQVKDRIKEIATAIEQSAANHNALLGRLGEAQHILQLLEKAALDVAEIVAEVV